MSLSAVIDLCSDDETRDSNVGTCKGLRAKHQKPSIPDQSGSLIDKSNLVCSAPICRQFWKAGNYEVEQVLKAANQNGQNYLHVHPMFLHSNATSHKWAFGAIAELLDNTVDEIQNGATFVSINKISNPRDGSPALLIQDDGGGMDPEALRRCISFGFSDKKSELAIGQYGNGFKASSMRLGADVILFSRQLKNRLLTQSVGLLSYTFLRLTGRNKIVVPMVHYEFNSSSKTFEPMHYHDKEKEYFQANLSMLLEWSPYSTEDELLKQFNDIGHHGTKIIIYNLWLNDEGNTELDFDTDAEDIWINCNPSRQKKGISNQHIANQYQYSLRVYSSILYKQLPDCFKIILRGRVVDCHHIARDLIYPEFIVYKPQTNGHVQAEVITTIGFVKEAPRVTSHGFNIYHRNRLILPFWPAVKDKAGGCGKGVVGVLQADFIQPTHNKQDFEKTSLFERLEDRLKQMTTEYWDLHCQFIGYQPKKRNRAASVPSIVSLHSRIHCFEPPGSSKGASLTSASLKDPLVVNGSAQCLGEPADNFQVMSKQGSKRSKHCLPKDLENAWNIGSEARATGTLSNWKEKVGNGMEDQLQDQETLNLVKENKRLQSLLLELEKHEEDLKKKVQQLCKEVEAAKGEYSKLLAELVITN